MNNKCARRLERESFRGAGLFYLRQLRVVLHEKIVARGTAGRTGARSRFALVFSSLSAADRADRRIIIGVPVAVECVTVRIDR